MNNLLINLASGILGAVIGAIISLVIYMKQRNDNLVDQLKIKFCNMHAQIMKARCADRYTYNSINQVAYDYHCEVLDDLKSLGLSLSMLLDNSSYSANLRKTVLKIEDLLQNELSKWHVTFSKTYFSTRKSCLTMLEPDAAERTMQYWLKQDLYSLKLQLTSIQIKFIDLEQEFLNYATQYINSKTNCFI